MSRSLLTFPGENGSLRSGLFALAKRESRQVLFCFVSLFLFIAQSGPIGSQGEGGRARPNALLSPEWRLEIRDPSFPVRPGLTIIYTISYENTGDAPATKTVIVDTIDARTEYLLSTRAGIYDPDSRTVTWTPGTIEPQESGILILRVKTPEGIPHGTEIVNTVAITCAEGVRTETHIETTVTYVPILRVYKRTPVRSASPGQEVAYDIDYANLGDTTATEVQLVDFLPEQTTLVSCTHGCVLDSSQEKILWRLGDVRPDALSSLQLAVLIDSTFSGGSPIINAVSITCAEASSDSSFCETAIDTTPSPSTPDITFSIKGRDCFVRAGEEMLYKIRCANSTREAVYTVVITDPVPDHTEYVACTGDGRYDPAEERVVWNIEELKGRQEAAVTLTVRVKSPLSTRTPIINMVTLNCAEGFSVSATETTVVLSAPAWYLTTVASPQQAIRGQPVTFTTRVKNTGNGNATNTILTNPIFEHTIYSSNTGGGIINEDRNAVLWDLGPIIVRQEVTVSLTVTVAQDFPTHDAVVNRVHIQSDGSTDSVSIFLPLIAPQSYELGQNHPNPFNQRTLITYQLPEDTHVLLKVYNILGQEIVNLVHEKRQAGMYSTQWDGKDTMGNTLPSGIYLYTLSADGGRWSQTNRMALLR